MKYDSKLRVVLQDERPLLEDLEPPPAPLSNWDRIMCAAFLGLSVAAVSATIYVAMRLWRYASR